jgi:hypothetical protein
MAIKKKIISTTGFIITALLLSQINSFKNNRIQAQEINLSAFVNLSENIKSISNDEDKEFSISENSVDTHGIIKIIEKEISRDIVKTKISINPVGSQTKLLAINKREKIKTVKAQEVPSSTAPGPSEDLSKYEINNSTLVNLLAISVEKIAFQKFENIKLALSYGEILKDEVAVAQASAENVQLQTDEITTSQPAPERKLPEQESKESKESKEEEMVMFEYSEKPEPVAVEKTIDQQLYERPMSKVVQRAISREMGSLPVKKLEKVSSQVEAKNILKVENQEIDLNSDEVTTYDYSLQKNTNSISDAQTVEKEIEAFTAGNKIEQAQFKLRAKEINLNTHKKRQAYSFEFVPDYDRSERSDDQASGEINFGYSLNGEMNTQTGLVQASGAIPTRIELNFNGNASFEIPLINEDGMQKFLQNKGINIEGNLILLAIDPSILDTEIDSKFDQRFYFDKDFKLVGQSNRASYVMYAGVGSGNIMLRYLLSNKEIAQKIIYVGDGEMYFEDPEFVSSSREVYNLTTRNLLGQKRKELIMPGENISFFATNIKSRKKALNAYEIKIPDQVKGMRNYLEFNNLKDTIIVGSSNERNVEIPSNDFIAKVLEMNQVGSLRDRCVVQLNLSKDIREIKSSGKNRNGEMFVETNFLDKDGNFSNESEMAEKAFIVGDMSGQFGIRLDYTDGTTDFLKTFCSNGTYLVEQL